MRCRTIPSIELGLEEGFATTRGRCPDNKKPGRIAPAGFSSRAARERSYFQARSRMLYQAMPIWGSHCRAELLPKT
jgi:hypothetical protein